MSEADSSNANHYYFFSDWKKDWWVHHALAKHPPYACFTRKRNIFEQVTAGDVIWQFTREPKNKELRIAGRLVTMKAMLHAPSSEEYDARYQDFTYKIKCCRERSQYFKLVPVSESMLELIESWHQTQKQMCRIQGYWSQIVIASLESSLQNPFFETRPLQRHTDLRER